jgi:hypothetical protein
MTSPDIARSGRHRKAFALVVALAVLVLLGMLAFGAASMIRVNQTFLVARIDDRRLATTLAEAAHKMAAQPLPAPGAPATEILRANLSGQDIQVSATMLSSQQGTPLLGAALKLRSGDQFVELWSAPVSNPDRRRGAVYLINSHNQRKGPILLLERRT